MNETPLSYPSCTPTPPSHCYIINETGQLELDHSHSHVEASTPAKSSYLALGCRNEDEMEELLRGCASVCEFGDAIMVSTHAVPIVKKSDGGHHHACLLVSISVGGRQTYRAQFNFQRLDQYRPIFVQSFLTNNTAATATTAGVNDNHDMSKMIQVNLIDESAQVIVLTIPIFVSASVPALPSTTNIVPGVHIQDRSTLSTNMQCHPGARLASAACTWLSSTRLLFAMSPRLFCVDIATNQCVDWSNYNSTVGDTSLYRRVSGMFTTPAKSRSGSRGNVPSLPITAAVCSTGGDDSNDGTGKKIVLTLHVDGTLRLWRYLDASNSLQYVSVRVLEQHANDNIDIDDDENAILVPEMESWSQRSNAVQLCSRMYLENRGYVLGVAIQTNLMDAQNGRNVFWFGIVYGSIDNIDDDDDEMGGPAAAAAGTTGDVLLELTAPHDLHMEALTSMTFALHTPRISLHCLCNTHNNYDHPIVRTGVMLTFEPSQVSIISTEGVVYSLDNLPAIASNFQNNGSSSRSMEDDVDVSCCMTAYDDTDSNNPNPKSDTERQCVHVDGVMMRRLFRPKHDLPPQQQHVFRALSRVLPPQLQHLVVHTNGNGNGNGNGVEATVLLAMRAWSQYLVTVANRRSSSANNNNTNTLSTSKTHKLGGGGIYQALTPKQPPSRSSNSTTGDAISSSSPTNRAAVVVQNRYNNWWTLLRAATEEANWCRMPVQLHCAASSGNWLVLRTERISAVTYRSSASAYKFLDDAALQIFRMLTRSNPHTKRIIMRINTRLTMMVSTATVLSEEQKLNIDSDLAELGAELGKVSSAGYNAECLSVLSDVQTAMFQFSTDYLKDWIDKSFQCTAVNGGGNTNTNDMEDSTIAVYGPVGGTVSMDGYEHLIQAVSYSLRQKLHETVQVSLSRCILLSICNGSMDERIRSNLLQYSIGKLARVKALQWVTKSSCSPSLMMNYVQKCVGNETSSLLQCVRNATDAFLVDGLSTDLAEDLDSMSALRLLAPLVAYSEKFELDENEERSKAARRKETVAMHLIAEARSSGDDKVLAFAAELYFEADSDPKELMIDDADLSLLLNMLCQARDDLELDTSMLASSLNEFLPDADSDVCGRMANLPTLRMLLAPYLNPDSYLMSLHQLNQQLLHEQCGNISLLYLLRQLQTLEHGMHSITIFGGCGDVSLNCAMRTLDFLNASFPSDFVRKMPETANLCSAALELALDTNNWTSGFQSCQKQPLPNRQATGFTRLVETMVSRGYVDELTRLPLGAQNGIDWYHLAVSAIRDKCDQKLVEGQANWSGCLYALHVSRNDWKSAAEVMHNWSYGACEQRDQQALASLAAANAIHLVPHTMKQFVVTGEYHGAPPVAVNTTVRSLTFENCGAKDKDDGRVSRLHSKKSLVSRSVITCAWNLLTKSGYEGSDELTDEETVQQLAKSGYILHAICLAKEIFSDYPKFFNDTLEFILCHYLLPATSTTQRSSFPTYEQLRAMTPNAARFRSAPSAAMSLLESLTTAFTTCTNNLAVAIAKRYIEFDDRGADLPLWLSDLLIGKKSSTSGLFASQSFQNPKANPAVLLRLYLNNGYFVHACNVVTTILADPARRKVATKRVPEKGGIDFVPYNDIDMLMHVTEKVIPMLNDAGDLISARESMIKGLEFHFELLAISEAGLVSARAISR